MDSSFNNGRWGSLPRRPRYPQNCTTPSPLHKPKVVSVPNPRSDYAIWIQKTWRGFRLRKSVKKIREIQREIGDVERSILDPQTVESLRSDERERLKVNERLMALLFRLDSIRGFDCAVKDLRRAVIRRAIVLQEKVDSVAVSAKNCIDHQSMAVQSGVVKLDCELEPVERELGNRMMKLMAELMEKSDKQIRMLSRLSERVGKLENALDDERHYRRAKKLKRRDYYY